MATQNSKQFHHNESLVFLYAENTSGEDGEYTLASSHHVLKSEGNGRNVMNLRKT